MTQGGEILLLWKMIAYPSFTVNFIAVDDLFHGKLKKKWKMIFSYIWRSFIMRQVIVRHFYTMKRKLTLMNWVNGIAAVWPLLWLILGVISTSHFLYSVNKKRPWFILFRSWLPFHNNSDGSLKWSFTIYLPWRPVRCQWKEIWSHGLQTGIKSLLLQPI